MIFTIMRRIALVCMLIFGAGAVVSFGFLGAALWHDYFDAGFAIQTVALGNEPDPLDGTRLNPGGVGVFPISTTPPAVFLSSVLPAARITGPQDAILGDKIYLSVETTGEARSFAWSVAPDVDGLDAAERKASFSNRSPGVYTFFVSVGFDGGAVAHDMWQVEIFPLPADQPISVQDLVSPPQPLDVGMLVAQWVAEVRSTSKQAEAVVIAGSFRSVGNLLATGQATDGADPLRSLEQACEEAIGPEPFARWESFFARLRSLVEPLNQSGVLSSNVEFARFLNNMAPLLEAAVTEP